jgi:hypothetical protein
MKWGNILTLVLFCTYFSCCHDNKVEPIVPNPPPLKPLSIFNLIYSPTEVPIELNPTFTISGTINFENAAGGVAKFRMTNSGGANVTVDIQGNTGQSNGLITGYFEFAMPTAPTTYTFDVWLIDAHGRESNKLSGMVKVIYDDRMIHWKKKPLPSESWRMNKICWATDQFTAVGNEGIIITSTDASTWTKETSGTNNSLRGIIWSGSQYVAVGDFSTILTSPDASIWNSSFSSDSNEKLYGISWSGHQYVAVGRDSVQDKTIILTSPDAVTWTKNLFTISGGELKSIAWSGNLFMAVGDQTDPCCRTPKCICSHQPVILTSADGITWTDHSTIDGALYASISNVSWDGARFILVSGYRVASSLNGTIISYNDNITDWMKWIAYTGKKYIGIGIHVGVGDAVYASAAPLDWYNKGNTLDNIPANTLTDIVWSGEKYVVTGVTGYMLVSPY